MRYLVCLLLIVSTAAYADDEDDDGFTPNRGHSFAIGIAGHGSRVHGQSEGGVGILGELAIGSGRWQYLGEALVGSASHDDPTDPLMSVGGRVLHAGAGLRWIARQFRPEDSAGVELFLASIASVERFYFDDGGRITRANASIGVGMQVRRYTKPHLAFRLDGRVVFFHDAMDKHPASPGFMTGFSCAW